MIVVFGCPNGRSSTGSSSVGAVADVGEQGSRAIELHNNIGALIIRIGFGRLLYYNHSKEPQNPILIIKAPILGLGARVSGFWVGGLNCEVTAGEDFAAIYFVKKGELRVMRGQSW